jgi:hypothetical protein
LLPSPRERFVVPHKSAGRVSSGSGRVFLALDFFQVDANSRIPEP